MKECKWQETLVSKDAFATTLITPKNYVFYGVAIIIMCLIFTTSYVVMEHYKNYYVA